MKPKEKLILKYMDELYPEATCELYYEQDYELLIATVLSAQCTDARVNKVTKELWQNYTLETLAKASQKEIEKIIRPLGSFTKKASYIRKIADHLVTECNGLVPNNREYLESLPGVGRKTCNVVLSNLFNVPTIAVDTHVKRVSKRLKLVKETDEVLIIEQKLMQLFPKEKWSRLHHQLVLFGRYQCKALNPLCEFCKLQKDCQYYQTKK